MILHWLGAKGAANDATLCYELRVSSLLGIAISMRMITILCYIVVWATRQGMGHHAGHIQNSVGWRLEIVTAVYWSIELLTVRILRLELKRALLEGGCATCAHPGLLGEVVTSVVSGLSAAATLGLMHEAGLSERLVAVMCTSVLRLA